VIALSKADLLPEDEVKAAVEEWRERLGDAVAGVVAISSATGYGMDDLRRAVAAALPEAPRREVPGTGEFEAEHRVYRPGEEEGFEVEMEEPGRFRVTGRGIEVLVARHDLVNPEALDYLESRLREIGVIAALERAGFESGDDVLVGEVEFALVT
jgi:Obg family GTPase CgtA-like protein